MDILYRICWKENASGFTGHGKYSLSFTSARRWIQNLDEKYKTSMIHWIEAIPSDSAALDCASSSIHPSMLDPSLPLVCEPSEPPLDPSLP
jgi:hypothetical protein